MTFNEHKQLWDWELACHQYPENIELPDCPIIEIPVNKIINRPDAAEQRIKDVIESISIEGQLTPIKVYRLWGKYRILEGRHRLIAIRELGWKTIKAQDITDYET